MSNYAQVLPNYSFKEVSLPFTKYSNESPDGQSRGFIERQKCFMIAHVEAKGGRFYFEMHKLPGTLTMGMVSA